MFGTIFTKRRALWEIVIAVALLALLLAPLGASAHGGKSSHGDESAKSVLLNQLMRKLWEDHITWTRMAIVSFAGGLPDLDPALSRLLQNQTDIGNALKPFYGQAAGDRLTALLREHILIAVDLLKAAKAGDTAGFKTANARWYANADEIAAFLHAANPQHWSLADMQTMMHKHLDLTLQEASARLTGNWSGDITAYDAVHLEILQMADMLSQGIVEQFPQQFK